MLRIFDNLSERNQGVVFLVAGAILILFTMGFMGQLLHYIIFAGGLYLVILGLFKLQVHKKVMEIINKKQ